MIWYSSSTPMVRLGDFIPDGRWEMGDGRTTAQVQTSAEFVG
jgi:hypothetical protein